MCNECYGRGIKHHFDMVAGISTVGPCKCAKPKTKIDYIRKEAELEKQNEGKETEIYDYDELQAGFVAGLFESDEVTKEAILNGLDSHDFKQVYDIVRYRVLGFSREEDEAAKKPS